MNNITCLDYESESTEDWVCSDMISFKMPVVGTENILYKFLSVFVFPTVNVFLDGDRAGSWWKLFIFLDEAGFTVTWPRDVEEVESGPERCSLGAWPPPTESDFEGPHSKIVQRA